ncbi:UDP-2,3-diacylglucosamine hydrolase, partial [Yersinia pestis PY-65]
MLMLYI